MSVWNTLSAGLSIVQEKLDHVLESDEIDGNKPQEGQPEGDGELVTPTVPPTAVLAQPASPSKARPTEDDIEAGELRLALERAEQQVQLLNTEYGKLLREKEEEIKSLREAGGGNALELSQKELAAHKEMVSELRQLLKDKELEFQELNSKAENKFNKLKTQAKSKIAALNKEVEQLRSEGGATSSFNVSALSLDDSLAGEVDALRQERDQQLTLLRDKLNVAEVCLVKERESVVRLGLAVTELEDSLARHTAQLSTATQHLATERDSNKLLELQVSELSAQLENAPPEVTGSPETTPNPVLAAGSRGGLLDLEAEIEHLSQELRDRDEQLSSFKTILEDREKTLAAQQESSAALSAQLELRIRELENEVETRDLRLQQSEHEKLELEGKLAVNNESLQQRESSLREHSDLELSMNDQISSKDQVISDLEKQLDKKEKQLNCLEESLTEEIASLKSQLSRSEATGQEAVDRNSTLSQQVTQLEEKWAKLAGALEFAQTELAARDSTIKTISLALEEKKSSLSALESELAKVRSANAERLTEAMQRSEVAIETRSELEHKLSSTQKELDTKHTELVQAETSLAENQTKLQKLQEEFDVCRSQLSVLEHSQSTSQVETESLRGQVESLSQAKSSFTEEHSHLQVELSDVKAQLSQSTTLVSELREKLKNAKQQLQKAAKAKQELSEQREQLSGDLERYRTENEQMKLQFDSAVKLMEDRSSQQTAALTQSSYELSQRDANMATLNEQLQSEIKISSELRDKVTRLSADYNVTAEQCSLLEQEKKEVLSQNAELAIKQSQLSESLSEVQTSREMLRLEHETLLRGAEDREGRVVELTQQLGLLARDKEGLESKVRELSHKLVSSEQRQLSMRAELEELQSHTQDSQHWEDEKQSLLLGQERLEQENQSLESSRSLLATQVEQLRTELEQKQDASQDQGQEADTTAVINDLQTRLESLQQSHLAELAQLQQTMDSELTRRELAEKQAQELRGEVAIAMEEVGVASGDETTTPQSLVEYLELGKVWLQRLIKNPNVVLMRLYRATPQTKLFFLTYFLLLHLMLLYLLIV